MISMGPGSTPAKTPSPVLLSAGAVMAAIGFGSS
jgi:hypothetical protein